MEVIELKFILKLLGKPGYRASITELKPNSKTRASERDKICRDLSDRKLVEFSEEVTKLKIAPPGKALLESDSSELPVKPQEIKILKACEKDTISPGKTGVPATERQSLIQSLAERGFIKAVQTQIKEVWLTETGKKHLLYEYNPSGYQPLYSGEMLNNYILLLRNSSSLQVTQTPTGSGNKLGDQEILQTIRYLDRELDTDNYLPIFHLREKLQPPLSREDLDQALYRLEQQDKIELSSLQEGMHYTKEQINQAIHQEIGGSLFFIVVN